MKKLSLICCLLVAISFTTSCINKSYEDAEVKLVTAEEMQTILDTEDVQLVDVRTPEEFEEVRIVDSQNIDFNSPTFDEDITKLDKEKPVILYCKGGNRSAKCAKKLKDAGFKKVYDLEGGISKWQHSDKIKIESTP
ncbi:rhodanese-like domain-containing protein [Winogradskyella sp. SYSU M77433]|uniref:rhodanese-like domain-containing protein n=1 Tax=Winogradskyella sp. SYSU M77433 TaxID=3042722 RepID=UPI002480D25D|nr:rhodanese-like domain-containing protein [Winogradskyella sp. SYSU M77433]MDH7913223.1 rhodanese-like domain-containing protein [Winogradskyella sp. SYSU M77433]|tara:strand:+ start:877 stop:1287 length:411 start_codon:yes stop_codon:yes gene_type:complete